MAGHQRARRESEQEGKLVMKCGKARIPLNSREQFEAVRAYRKESIDLQPGLGAHLGIENAWPCMLIASHAGLESPDVVEIR
jgi:hypothetical protein